jgi:hypothetical protein
MGMKCLNDNANIAASGVTGEIHIFSVEDGRLLRIRSFAASVSCFGVLLVSGSFIEQRFMMIAETKNKKHIFMFMML